MDNESAADEASEATPIFTAYRRGYDPEQVDRYVADQRRRLDDATTRASEAERKLAAAVGQLRELHRRVAVLESEDRTAQTPALDAIGERIQRILQEAWDGAYAMRQAAENDVNESRERARSEAESIIATARHKAVALGEELERRRSGFLQRVEEERSKAVTQMTFLSEQRKLALTELVRIRTLLDATVDEFSDAPVVHAVPREMPRPQATTPTAPRPSPAPSAPASDARPEAGAVATLERPRPTHSQEMDETDGLPRTMPVHRLPEAAPEVAHDPSELVRSHRAMTEAPEHSATVHELDSRRARPALFDFEEDDSPTED